MNKLSKLFQNCAYTIHYETTGHSVNYAFVENLKERKLEIYFQGSNSNEDWFRNFFFFPIIKRPYKNMGEPFRVHRGFLSAWKEVEDIIIAKITEVKNPKAPLELQEYKWKHITVVGYSHGAALAGFCHECVWYYRQDLRESGLEGYGFEAPRFYGGFRVKKALRERWEHFTVVRTNNDIVTHCPPRLFRFTHVGKLLKIKGDTSLAPKKWYLPRCVKSHYPEVVYDALYSADL